jgi:hypothetical protein
MFCGIFLLAGSGLSQAANYEDWWYNPNLSGMGLNIGQQDRNIFVTWFMYDEAGNPSFLLFYGDLDENQSLTAELRRYHGPEPIAYDETLWYGEVVGTASIAFSSPAAGTFTYQYDGKTGFFPIERYTFHTINLSGTYHASDVGLDSNCGDDGRWSGLSVLSLTHNGTDLTGTVTDDLGVYYVALTTTQHGSLFTASGSFTSSGPSGSFSMSNVRLIDGFLTFDYVAIDGAGCRTDGHTAAVRW